MRTSLIALLLVLALQGTTYKPGQIFTIGLALPGTCQVGDSYILQTGSVGLYVCTATNVWTAPPPPIPSGAILLVASGSCPTGFTESSALDGKFLIGTVAANGNVGTTGGADTITPAGSNSAPAFTGSSANTSAVTAGTPAGTNGTSTVTPLGTNATSTVTPLGTNGTSTTTATGTINTPTLSWPAGVPTFAGSALATHTHTTTATGTISALTTGADSSTTGGVAKAIAQTPTFTGNSVTSSAVTGGTPAGTVAWPAGVPTSNALTFTGSSSTVAAQTFTGSSSTVAAQTFTGSSSTVAAQTFTGSALGTHLHALTATGTVAAPTFTGTSFDNRPAFVRIIACSKT